MPRTHIPEYRHERGVRFWSSWESRWWFRLWLWWRYWSSSESCWKKAFCLEKVRKRKVLETTMAVAKTKPWEPIIHDIFFFFSFLFVQIVLLCFFHRRLVVCLYIYLKKKDMRILKNIYINLYALIRCGS